MDRDLTCRELVEFLDDYIAHDLAGEALASFEKHLSDCPPCVAYLETYRQSIRMGRAVLEGPDAAVPQAVPEELIQAILDARRRR
jgi:anti-sigma factor RsiW